MQNEMSVSPEERVLSLDVLRGIAVLGILMLNVLVFGFGFTYSGSLEMGYLVKQSSFDITLYRVIEILGAGKMRGIFSVLFGVSAMLILSKQKTNTLEVADAYYRRLIWLLIFGLLNGFVFLWKGDVLFCYALCGLFLFPLRNASFKLLVALIIIFNLAMTARVYIRHEENLKQYKTYQLATIKTTKHDSLSTEEKNALQAWKKKTAPPSADEIKAAKEERSGGYFDVMIKNLRDTQLLESVLFYRYFFFDMMIMMLMGMILYRADYFSPTFPNKKLWLTGTGSYILGFPLVLWAEYNVHSNNYHPIDRDIFQLIHPFERLFITLGHICLILLAIRSKALTWIVKLLARTGKMAFTNYLLQSVICLFIFSGFAFDLYAKLRVSELMIVVVCIWIFEIIFSVTWLRYFKMGPFEWLWRSLTNWELVPIRKVLFTSTRQVIQR